MIHLFQTSCPDCYAAPRPPITARSGGDRGRRGSRCPRTPAPWSGWWKARAGGTGAGSASAARTAGTAFVSTCGTTWCTCRHVERDRDTAWHVARDGDRCDVTWPEHGKCQTHSVQLFSHRSVIVTPRAALTSPANQRPAHRRLTNESAARRQLWHRDKLRRTEELTLASFAPVTVTCDELCHKKCPGSHSCMRPAPQWSILSLVFAVNLTFDWSSYWSWLTLIEANNQTRAILPSLSRGPLSVSGNQREAGMEWSGCCVSCWSWAGYFNSFHFMSSPPWKSIWAELQVNGEWLQHLAPLKARRSISPLPAYHWAALHSPASHSGETRCLKCRNWSHIKMFYFTSPGPARQSHGGKKVSRFTLNFLIRAAGSDYENLIGFRLVDWNDRLSPLRVAFCSMLYLYINQSLALNEWLKIVWGLRRLKRNSCFDGSAFIINQVRIITNQKWIKIRFNARRLWSFFIITS